VTAPELSRRDLEAQVRALVAAGRQRPLMAIYGRGVEDVLDLDGTRVRVMPVRSELDLRRQLLDVARDEYAAFLIPWRAASLPIDLQGWFAKSGKIFVVGPEERLRTRFGVTEVDDDARECPLASYVLEHHAKETFSVPGGRLTLDALWTAWLARVWKLDAGGELALDALLGWAAIDGRGPQFADTMKASHAEPVRTALLEYLGKKLGPAGPVVWTAWERGQGAATLQLAIVLGALAGSTDRGVEVWIAMTAERTFGAAVDTQALARLGDTADAALRFIARSDHAGTGTVRSLILAADQIAANPAIADQVIGSSRLPSAWRARLERFGTALAGAAETPNAATVRAAVEAWGHVWRHDMAQDPDQTPVLRRAQMALRVASWLAMRSDRELPLPVTPYDDVENIASWYVREGGYLDRARRWARGVTDGAFGAGIEAVLRAVDDVRVELDRRFARALPEWHRAGRRATQVVPIEQAVKRVATQFLDEGAERRLLVILMDGMAWSQAVELLESMGSRASVWGPLAWHAMPKHRIGDAPFPPVLTNFPTLTEVSRSAFFASKVMTPGAANDSSKDVERWKANRDVLKHVPPSAVPQLRLRGENQTSDGSASNEALELVLDRQHKVVAVVLNAIDMSLKADRGHEVEWTLDTLRPLRELLDKAREAGRAVLLCSDHGHVPSDRLAPSGTPMSQGARWRVWDSERMPVVDYEIAIPAGEGVWAPRGAHGVIMIADDAHRYGGGTGAGEHGGASLAEVVAPCVLIGCADVPAATDDAAQAVRPAAAPSWWFFDVPDAPASDSGPIDRGKKPKRTTKRPTDNPQPFLPTMTPPSPPEPPAREPPPAPAQVESPLAQSELFVARAKDAKLRKQALQAVEFLRLRKGVAAAPAFATELGEFAARVGGVVARLQEILNVDGYQVLRFDRQAQQVHLDLEKLAQQFGVELGK